jgi:myxalamid-type polyketide synthase MxaE and MxaD
LIASFDSADDLRQVRQAVGPDFKGVVYIAAANGDRLEAPELVASGQHPLQVVQALLATRLSPPGGLWLVTRGSRSPFLFARAMPGVAADALPRPVLRERAGVRVISSTNEHRNAKSPSSQPSPGIPGEGADDARPTAAGSGTNIHIAPALEQSALWGLGRGVALEAPELSTKLVDLDPGVDPNGCATALLAEIDDSDSEDQIALRFQQRYVPRLMPVPELAKPVAPLRLSGTHLITGGLGGLGAQLAISLAAAGAEHLILIVKHPLPERSRWEARAADSADAGRVAIVRQIESAGARVTVAAMDLTDASSLAEWFVSMDFSTLPLRGIWHTAMSLSSSPLMELDPGQVSRMIAVKSATAWLLHELSLTHQLDYFVLFSSTTALWGAAGLAHYAAANAFLDALGHFRRANGLPANVINWGTWQQMRGLSTTERDKAVRVGLRPMPAPMALAALQRVLAAGKCQTVVADIDWSIFKPAYESRRHQPFLEQIGIDSATNAPPVQNAPAGLLLDRLNSAAADERRELLAQHVQQLVNAVLGAANDGFVDRIKGFFEMGMDSLTSVQLRRRLEQDVRRALPSTLTFNYPTIDSLADFLMGQLFPAPAKIAEVSATVAAAPPNPAPVLQSADEAEETEDELFEQLAARLSARRN